MAHEKMLIFMEYFLDNENDTRVIKEKIAVTILEYTHVLAVTSQ